MAGAFLGGVGGIDSPHALVSELSVTSSPINPNLSNKSRGRSRLGPYFDDSFLHFLKSHQHSAKLGVEAAEAAEGMDLYFDV